MSFIGRGRAWLRAVVFRSRIEREMREEMAAHLEQSTARYVARGMTVHDARHAARREFGVLGVMQDAGRDARGARLLHSVSDDVRYALRYFARTPGRTALIVVVLTLGIGIAGATISATQGLLHRPPPGVTTSSRLVAIRGVLLHDGRRREREFSYAEFEEYVRASQLFERVVGWTRSSIVLETGDAERPVVAATSYFVTAGYFGALGARLSAGRGFALEGSDALARPELEAVMSDRLATQLFGTPAQAIGEHVRVNHRLLRIVGVTARRFHGAGQDDAGRAVWMPLSAQRIIEPGSSEVLTYSDTARFRAFAQLRYGVSGALANEAVAAIAQRSAARRVGVESTGGTAVAADGRWGATVGPIIAGARLDEAKGDELAVMSAVGAAVVLIVLICAMTVATLLIGAALQRHGEIGVRLALGASRSRIVRQLLTESAVLCTVSTMSGLLLYAALCRVVFERGTDLDIAPDRWTLLYTTLVAALTTVVCGLIPALNATRHSLADTLKQSTPTATSRSRLQKTFVATQIALTQPMLVGLALLLLMLSRGFDSASARAASERLTLAIFDPMVPEIARQGLSGRELARRLATLPGVVSAVSMPLAGHLLLDVQIDGDPGNDGRLRQDRRVRIATSSVSPAYFKTLDLPIVRGRDFRDGDRVDGIAPAIITTDVATRLFGAADPVGRRVSGSLGASDAGGPMFEIIGVAAADPRSSDDDRRNRIYTLSESDVPASVLIRTANAAEPLFPAFRAILNAEAPAVPLHSLRTYAQIDAEKRRQLLQAAGAVSAAGIVTLLLAAIGLFAVIALAIGQRHREIGIRIALGARSAQVVSHFLRGGLSLTLVGLAFGLPASAVALSLIDGGADVPVVNVPAVAAMITASVVGVALLATWLSARRAARIDPMIVMRDA